MIQYIKYNGYTAAPSDYECHEGDLALAMNAVVENGSVKRVDKPKVVLTLPSGKKVIYIHAVSVFENYIIHDTNSNKLEWLPSDNPSGTPMQVVSLISDELYNVTAIGNTLVILTSSGVKYALYKSGSYKIISSNKPVFPALSFRLNTSATTSDVIVADFPGFTPYKQDIVAGSQTNTVAKPGEMGFLLTNEARASIKDKVLAYINPLMAECRSEGRFQYPFMVRYAYKLYDNSLLCMSAPIYMSASRGIPFAIKHESEHFKDNQYKDVKFKVISISSTLAYEITNYVDVENSLAEWKDLIQSIEVYVTPPMHMVDEESIADNSFFTAAHRAKCQVSYVGYNGESQGSTHIHRYHRLEDDLPPENLYYSINGKEIYSQDALKFHLVASIDVSGRIPSGERILNIEKDVLSSLDARELMVGDSHVNDTLIAKRAYVYNGRLNLTGVTAVPEAYPLESCVQFCNASDSASIQTYGHKVYVSIEAEKTRVCAKADYNIQLNINRYNSFFFFPNLNANRVIIERIDSSWGTKYSSNQLSRHGSLHGTFCYIDSSFSGSADHGLIGLANVGIPYPGKIYTTNVNNPFLFPATGVNAIGSGTVYNICSAAKALSEGQFGQFPLYAFTDEGVWALDVARDGSYSAEKPFTRDVCISADSITQLDDCVLFATDRGIMLLDGAVSICITELIDSETEFSLVTLPKGADVLKLSKLQGGDIKIVRFRQFLRQSRMLYDYIHQRVIVYNPAYTYTYVFSLESKQWGMMESNIASGVNSYPEAYAMDKGNQLLNFSEEVDAPVNTLLVTRPFALSNRDVHKTIKTIIQRGMFQRKDVAQVLYGSNDLEHWHVIRSSVDEYLRGFSGTPYKAFCLALICNLERHESLSGCSVYFDPRMNNKLR